MVTLETSPAFSQKELRKYSFLTAICHEEHEAYFPTDGGTYLDRSYFKRVSHEEIRGYWDKTVGLIKNGNIPRELGLYIHWPFCISRCSFCFCAMCLTTGRGELRRYHQMLKREIDAIRDIFVGTEFQSIYIGGGTPSLMPEDLMRDLFSIISDSFLFEKNAEIYMEASPATLSPDKLKLLRELGVNHITLGVQSLDNLVLHKVNRAGQTRENVVRTCGLLTKDTGIISAADLMYGLEGQTDRSFLSDFHSLLKAGPRNLRVYAFDPRVQTEFTIEGKAAADNLRDKQWEMIEGLDQIAEKFGYRTAPLDPEEDDYLSAITRQCRMARKWGASVLGIGTSSLSHAFGSAWYGHPSHVAPSPEISNGAPRNWRGIPDSYAMPSDLIEEMRGFTVRHLHTQAHVSRKGFKTVFGSDILEVPALADAFADLSAAGKVRIDDDYIRFLSKDRLERLVYTKRLFSPKLTAALLRGNRAKFREFNKRFTDKQVQNLDAVSDKRIASLMRMYYRPEAPRPEWFRNSMESENLCRLQKRKPA